MIQRMSKLFIEGVKRTKSLGDWEWVRSTEKWIVSTDCQVVLMQDFTFIHLCPISYEVLDIWQDAVSDLSNAHEVSPDDDTISDVLRYEFIDI